ncbi:bifunctional folylpolyglutamate synthase/dihydrofolate synthase [Hydrogenothermus marinus]|uniref:Dihydrofolate synthase/folylpolyglutamate synthase n=1 Tax=Hydrogenothermus marinus TaxID=133270 RepID=A0A3M0BS16_9AQUI|nr:folylpolyglutamate synthase/dihydrofolate synthase family protein [Hydrogenothermus marinus]RMA97628.1 dihydrofolate synthase/folylpolyglutamate synthase [Hydrogenothermus marinus]
MKLYKLFEKKVFNIEPGLERIKKALNDIKNPHQNFKSILVAGTNGKGSTSAFLESIFRNYGFKTGLFTSPHLIEENERWQINRKNIPDYKLENYIKQLKQVIKKYNLTYFEASTLFAFKYFSDEKVDIAILEVGLGGRWDSTNVVEPEVSIITNVSFDHMHMLGDTLDKIAFEKTGITRENKPAIIGRNQKEIINWLKKRNIKRYYVKDIDFKVFPKGNTSFDYQFQNIKIENIKPSLIGNFQFENAATAITSFIIFAQNNNIQIDKELLKKSISFTKWIGRLQILSKNPLIILDGAHNEDALTKSFKEIKRLFPDKKIITLYSGMKDKDFKTIFNILKENSENIYFTKIPVSRSIDKDFIPKVYNFIENIPDAIKTIKKNLKQNELLFITGSLYLVGEVLKQEDIWTV